MRSLYYLGNARTQEQYDEMVRLTAEGKCLFCPEVLRHDDGNRIVHETKHWMVTPNEYPYAGTTAHLLLIPKVHAESLLDLPIPALENFWSAVQWIKDEYDTDYFGLGARNGPSEYTGSTIRHVHCHFIVGDPRNEGEAVRLFLSSRPSPDPSPFA